MPPKSTDAQRIADQLNRQFKRGETFATAIYSWAGTPWRPMDTSVGFKWAWAEGNVLVIETTPPYSGPVDTGEVLRIEIEAPAGTVMIGEEVVIPTARWVRIGDSEGRSALDGTNDLAFTTRR